MSTGERLVPEPEVRVTPASGALPVASLLAICDGLLDEIGRRRHLFAWLRDPQGGSEEWLPVDAYYPGNRVVVVSAQTAAGHDALYAELVPAHRLKLLTLDPSELGPDPGAAKDALATMISSLALPERHVAPPPPRENPVAKALQSLVPPPTAPAAERRQPPSAAHLAAAQRGARFVDAHKSELSHPQRAGQRARPRLRPPSRTVASPRRRSAAPDLDALGLLMGSALFAVLCSEIYLAIAVAWLRDGRGLLGLGILLDACCRLLGTIAAGRVHSRGWAWGCLLGGSPVVVWFAFFQRSGPVSRVPGPLAGLCGLPAIALIALGLLI